METMSFDMAVEEDGKDDYFLKMCHRGLGHNQGFTEKSKKVYTTLIGIRRWLCKLEAR